jgi:hypothetical protein
VFGAIEPAYLQDFCWSNRLSDDFESVLINARGKSPPPADRPTSAANRRSSAPRRKVLFNGRCAARSERRPEHP